MENADLNGKCAKIVGFLKEPHVCNVFFFSMRLREGRGHCVENAHHFLSQMYLLMGSRSVRLCCYFISKAEALLKNILILFKQITLHLSLPEITVLSSYCSCYLHATLCNQGLNRQ